MTLQRVLYAGGEIVTTEAAAHAVLEYAAELGNRGKATTIRMPAAGLPDGATVVELLLGPASQLTSEPVESDMAPPDDAAFLLDIRARMTSEPEPRPWDVADWESEV